MDEIARVARLTKPMIYYHFKNKPGKARPMKEKE
jgi:AcrR family transcriptional regulator